MESPCLVKCAPTFTAVAEGAALKSVQVLARVPDGKRAAHEGIKVEFVGSIGASVCNKTF